MSKEIELTNDEALAALNVLNKIGAAPIGKNGISVTASYAFMSLEAELSPIRERVNSVMKKLGESSGYNKYVTRINQYIEKNGKPNDDGRISIDRGDKKALEEYRQFLAHINSEEENREAIAQYNDGINSLRFEIQKVKAPTIELSFFDNSGANYDDIKLMRKFFDESA